MALTMQEKRHVGGGRGEAALRYSGGGARPGVSPCWGTLQRDITILQARLLGEASWATSLGAVTSTDF
jgi:hypothetical protein